MRSPTLFGHSERENALLLRLIREDHVEPFLLARGLSATMVNLLSPEDWFGALEFGEGRAQRESMKFFYPCLFADLRRGEAGKMVHVLKLSVTHDRRMCTEICDKTSVAYGEIRLGSKLAAIVIYVDANALLRDFFERAAAARVRQHSTDEVPSPTEGRGTERSR